MTRLYDICMSDATRSETARQNALARWGTRRIDNMISELGARRAELGDQQRAELRQLLDSEENPR